MWVQSIAIYQVYICKLPVDKDSGVEAKPVILASAVAARLMLAALKGFRVPSLKGCVDAISLGSSNSI